MTSISVCRCSCFLALLRLALSTLISSSIGSLCSSLALASLLSSSSSSGRLTFSALLLGCSIGTLSGLALTTLLCGGGSSLGCLALTSLLRGSSCTALGCLALSILLSSSITTLFGIATTSSRDSSHVNTGSVQGVDVVLVASSYDGLDSLLKVRTRVGGTSITVLSQQHSSIDLGSGSDTIRAIVGLSIHIRSGGISAGRSGSIIALSLGLALLLLALFTLRQGDGEGRQDGDESQ
ncbi:hypothetical protein F5883DRAFT_578155 [Diaporthe sp. PMI_573]|nr:hypothetical protein F5883DRAFT_578155 [Diaporthaceae sp. PMI_573]